MNPKNNDLMVVLGDLYLDIKRFEEAEKCYNDAVQINPKFSEGWMKLANYYTIIDKKEKANECTLNAENSRTN